jgi:hypothetical protein
VNRCHQLRPTQDYRKDIQRRFLPESHRFHELAMERKRQHDQALSWGVNLTCGRLIRKAACGIIPQLPGLCLT